MAVSGKKGNRSEYHFKSHARPSSSEPGNVASRNVAGGNARYTEIYHNDSGFVCNLSMRNQRIVNHAS